MFVGYWCTLGVAGTAVFLSLSGTSWVMVWSIWEVAFSASWCRLLAATEDGLVCVASISYSKVVIRSQWLSIHLPTQKSTPV